jgi:hypothetical protein
MERETENRREAQPGSSRVIMPSRVAAVAKVIVCSSTNSSSRPGTAVPSRPVATQPQARDLHIPTQNTLKSSSKTAAAPALSRAVSLSLSSLLHRSLYISHPPRHHHSTNKMDAALAKLFVSNAQWVKAVNTTESGFFEQSAKGQSPKVRFRLR